MKKKEKVVAFFPLQKSIMYKFFKFENLDWWEVGLKTVSCTAYRSSIQVHKMAPPLSNHIGS